MVTRKPHPGWGSSRTKPCTVRYCFLPQDSCMSAEIRCFDWFRDVEAPCLATHEANEPGPPSAVVSRSP